MKRNISNKIVWLLLLLIVIIFASTTFGTFDPFDNVNVGSLNTPTIPQFAIY